MQDARFKYLMEKPIDKLTKKEMFELLLELKRNYMSKYAEIPEEAIA